MPGRRGRERWSAETFPEKVRTLTIPWGLPGRSWSDITSTRSDRSGFNLLPTTGTKVKEGASPAGRHGCAGGAPCRSSSIRRSSSGCAGRQDRSVLYYGVADEIGLVSRSGTPAESAAQGCSRRTAGRAYVAVDLRDLPVARYYLRPLSRSSEQGRRHEAARALQPRILLLAG